MRRSAIPYVMEFDSLPHLLPDCFFGSAVTRMESGIVTERAASYSLGSVSVGTSEARVNHKFLQSLAIFLLEITGESVVAFCLLECCLRCFSHPIHIAKNPPESQNDSGERLFLRQNRYSAVSLAAAFLAGAFFAAGFFSESAFFAGAFLAAGFLAAGFSAAGASSAVADSFTKSLSFA